MTTIAMSARKCPLCNKITRTPELTSTNQSGPCDLDTRPAEMMRSTMSAWVHECPNCGYVGSKLTDRSKLPQEFFKSDAYLSCDGIVFKSDLARKFYKLYLVKREEQDARNAFWSALEAAWASDDDADVENAARCRKLALEQLETLIARSPEDPHLQALRIDVLRRSGQFEQAIARCDEFKSNEPLLNAVVKFERERAQASDDACYTVADASPESTTQE